MKLAIRVVSVERTTVSAGDGCLNRLDGIISGMQPTRVFILVDTNTRYHCLPVLAQTSRWLSDAHILEIPDGEQSKQLENCRKLWSELSGLGADRKSLLINVGGGVVADLGGFMAAGFMRGIRYINIPTTLIGMADAAIGGKTAVNLGVVKNLAGFFYPPEHVFIWPGFLATLPERHRYAGFAEIVKSALVGDAGLWKRICRKPLRTLLSGAGESKVIEDSILGAIKIKSRYIRQDFREKNRRKALNFGHTIGHALEALSNAGEIPEALHGECVAAGMICATRLSVTKCGLSTLDADVICRYLSDSFPTIPMDDGLTGRLLSYAASDKKSVAGRSRFTLLTAPGIPKLSVECSTEEILEAVQFWKTQTLK